MPDAADTTRETDEELNPDERPMSFLDHLEELRWTLVKSLVAFVIAFIISAVFFKDLARLLRLPLDRGLAENPESFTAITNTPMAVFSIYVTIPAIGGVVGALPFVLFFIGQFVGPALTPKEKRLLVPGGIIAIVLFLLGAAFSYFLLIPSIMKVSVELNAQLGTQLYWTIDKYYSMLLWIMLGMGLAFQFPLVVQVLIYLDIVSVEKLRSLRRIMFIACCLIAALITPTPDPFNMFMVALPLYLLYEAAILVGATFTARKAAARKI